MVVDAVVYHVCIMIVKWVTALTFYGKLFFYGKLIDRETQKIPYPGDVKLLIDFLRQFCQTFNQSDVNENQF